MEDHNKRYWKGLEELSNDTEFVKLADQEFPGYVSVKEAKDQSPVDATGTNRRDFLKMLGFSVAAASLAACEAPVVKAIPYLNKPENLDPGIANWYSSTFMDGGEYASVLVKTREGRPIKIEGNPSSSITKGSSNARVQASVLSLYDGERLKGPTENGKPSNWENVDGKITAQLAQIAQNGGAIRLVSSTILSPSTKSVIANFITKYPTAKHIVYDANSSSAIVKANEASFGKAVFPAYDFSKAKTIVSINADFLGTWVAADEYSRQYAQTRKLGREKKEMSRHYQFETAFSLTGGNADYRTGIKPSQEGLVVAALYNKVAKLVGGIPVSAPAIKEVENLDRAANDLVKQKGNALVVSGSNDISVQILVNAVNSLLGSYSSTINLDSPIYYKQGNDADMAAFVNEAKAGIVKAVIFYNANPVYNYPAGTELATALAQIPLSISFADRADETASLSKFICPDHNYLEAWNDAEPRKGFYSLGQPTISPLFKTRQAQESLLTWAGSNPNYYTFIRSFWKTNLYPLQSQAASFNDFWNRSLHDGTFELATASVAPLGATSVADLSVAAANIARTYKPESASIELVLYEKVAIGTGAMANNPWLQELPDPVSKACWDNYLAISKAMATKLGVEQGDYIKLEVPGKPTIEELPVLIQPGQTDGTVALSIGYGRTKAGKAANGVGVNAYPYLVFANNSLSYSVQNVRVTKTSGSREIAQTQTHHTIMGRSVVQEARLSQYQKDPAAGRVIAHVLTSEGKKPADEMSMWSGHEKKNHSWGMVIDLNSCTGCSACVVSCHAENNVPVVGRQEVLNRRDMHWLRIDRYYSSDADTKDKSVSGLKALEAASDNPEVVFQPMLCQHCNNAPCETVCPVAATTHSSEGINQMVYNRCIGTRYCANNCPYKVRRFNWFKYFENENFPNNPANDDLGRMVLNPDVTVRSRGVMEKCSFCVQRIQEGKLTAKKERRRPVDGEIITACAQSCPTEAIVFGDMNDPESRISKVLATEVKERAFQVLAEINTRPQISYLTKIRNKEIINNKA